MNKRDRRIVAVIAVIALVAGLVLVAVGLKHARQREAEWLENRWTDRPGVSETEGDGEAEDPDGDAADGTGGEADASGSDGEASGSGSGSDSGSDSDSGIGGAAEGDDASSSDGTAGGDTAGDPSGAQTPDGEQGGPDQTGDGSGAEDGTEAGDGTGNEDGTGGGAGLPAVPPLTEPDLGNPPVMSSGGELTAEALEAWITGESTEALEAQRMLVKEQAVATGAGSSGDPERRAYAEKQAQPNYEARINQLTEKGRKLALDYGRAKAAVAAERAGCERLQALLDSIGDKITERKGRDDEWIKKYDPDHTLPAQLEKDQQRVTAALEESKTALAKAETELTYAAEAINTATGNPAGTPVTMSGELELVPAPAVSGDAAVSLALANRNEINAALQDIVRAQTLLKDMKYHYAPDSAEILDQENELARAQAAYPAALNQVEQDVRQRSDRLAAQRTELEKLLAEPEGKAPEYQLKSRKEEAEKKDEDEKPKVTVIWESNLDAVLQAGQTAYGRDVKLAAGLAGYAQSVLEFEHAIGVGTAPAQI